jgi:hypothetical protein
MEYEVIVFENTSPYDQQIITDLSRFVEICKYYVNPEYVTKDEVSICFGSSFFSYADKSGNDKPMNVILVGKLSAEEVSKLKEELKKLYD